MKVISQSGLPLSADEWVGTSQVPMPSFGHPMPFAGPYNPLTHQPSSPAVANVLEENLRQMGVDSHRGEEEQNRSIMSRMPGASIGKPISCSQFRVANEEAGWSQAGRGELDLKMGYPAPTGTWVEAEVRYDGQDGNQWDQLIKEGSEEAEIKEERFSKYDAKGPCIDDRRSVGSEEWGSCEPSGLSWWPVLHLQLDLTHSAARVVPKIKEVEIYACWYQLLSHELWRGPDQFWIEAWTVKGKRFAEETPQGRIHPDHAARLGRNLQRYRQDVLSQSSLPGPRYQSAEDNANG